MIHPEERRKIDQLFREVGQTGMSRRQMIQRAAVLGISGSALTLAFVAKAHPAVAQGDDNPLGVDPEAPLDIVVFKGGYGDDYAINVKDMYQERFPDSEIAYIGTQRLQEQFQPRVVDGNPPDVMLNGGAGSFNVTTLYNEGQLTSLDDLMTAPAYQQEDITFLDSVVPGSQAEGVYDGSQYSLKYSMNINGVWFNQALLDEHGWEYPKTWDDMLALCETIKTETDIAPWTYQGLYPYYVRYLMDELIFKNGGWEAALKLDNLAEDAWTQEPVRLALEALRALYDNDYIMEGTEGLSHTESQTFWLEGDAVFIPCGNWLENEMKDAIPEDFQMTMMPAPSLTTDDVMPMSAITSTPAGGAFVFANAKNIQGGKEYLRMLFSPEAAKFFSETTHSPTVVLGSTEGVDLGKSYASVAAAVDAAGADNWTPLYGAWYADLFEEAQNSVGGVVTGAVTVDEMIETCQALTDDIRNNPDIPKLTREMPGAEATPAS